MLYIRHNKNARPLQWKYSDSVEYSAIHLIQR